MKETKIVTFESADLEKIITAVCKKKFPNLTIDSIDFDEGNEVRVVFDAIDPEVVDES